MRRFIVGTIGGGVLLVGVVMIVLPAPAVLVIPAGLAILAQEFSWAERLLERVKVSTAAAHARLRGFRRDGASA